MSKAAIRTAIAVVIAAFSCVAWGECTYPKAPDKVPEGKTASEQEMVAGMQSFKAYNEEVVKYGTCLEEEVKSQASSVSTSQLRMLKEAQVKKTNSAIGELQAKAKEFNEQVKAFKSRS